jgi:type I restriction enzyme S subunit
MKNGWEVKELAAVSTINYGYTESASSEPVGPRFLRITDIQDDGVNWVGVPYCRVESADLPKYRLATGDIVFARTGATTGKSFLVNDPPEAVFASYLIRLRLLDKNLLPEFVSLFFQTDGYWKSIKDGSAGSAQGGFNATKLGALSIPIPPLPEQQRIVSILDEAFEGIAAAKANAEKNLQNARALFESHLQSVFTQRGPGWVEKRLLEIAKDFGRGKSKHRPRNEPKLYGGKYPFVQTGDISNANHRITSYSQTYSEDGLAQSRLWPKGTVCIAIVGATVGETAILDFDACFPDSVIGIVANEQLADYEYVEYLLQSFKAVLKEKGKGTARDNINLGTFEGQKFPFPKLEVQRKIVSTLNALDEETQRLESIYQQKLDALEALKQSLLHQAFTGNL